MPTTITPQRRALGEALRRYRKATALTAEEVEDRFGWHPGKTNRVERGFRVPVRAELQELFKLYRVPAAKRKELLELLDMAKRRQSVSHTAEFGNAYLTMEREAAEICYFDDVLIHGLLQTEDYARALVTQEGIEHAELRIQERLARQKRVLGAAEPPHLRMLLGEHVTMQAVGGPKVLRNQLIRLAEAAATETTEVRLIPWSAGAHTGLGNSFTLLHLERPARLGQVYSEGVTGATYLHHDDEVATYRAAFEHLWNTAAADHAESMRILGRRIDTLGEAHGSDAMA